MNNGKEFENLIIKSLEKTKNGYFVKSPTPFRTIREGDNFKFIYSSKALCDFIGIFESNFILIEAKSISNSSFPLKRLKKHQIDQLSIISNLGGHSFIVFEIKSKKKLVAFSIKKFINITDKLKRKSINIEMLIDEGTNLNFKDNKIDFKSLFRKSIKFDNFF